MNLGGRYGVTNRFEVEARVPYIYRTDDTLARSITSTSQNELFSSDGNGIGDIELAARYQLNAPRDDGAFYIAGLRFKSRTGKDVYEVEYDPLFNLPTELATGSGFYSLQPSLSGVLPSDPVVFFGGVNYTWNIKRDVNEMVGTEFIGEVDPGDSFGLNFGMGLSLNERSSFSVSYEHTWIEKSTFEGMANDALDVQLGTLQTTFAYRLNKTHQPEPDDRRRADRGHAGHHGHPARADPVLSLHSRAIKKPGSLPGFLLRVGRS